MFTVVHCLILEHEEQGKGTCCPYCIQSRPPSMLYAGNTALGEGKPKEVCRKPEKEGI